MRIFKVQDSGFLFANKSELKIACFQIDIMTSFFVFLCFICYFIKCTSYFCFCCGSETFKSFSQCFLQKLHKVEASEEASEASHAQLVTCKTKRGVPYIQGKLFFKMQLVILLMEFLSLRVHSNKNSDFINKSLDFKT